ncbi:thiamine pyrophosphate-binding protein [Nocardia sp. CA2R105]|uniref:thiamine pyrophosphate-binding protein n=1 Tax=Nocardia coffeae TaxID=2873381 RepID=UPI001CA6258D|nr:thiamine pyrophosphate-binding protein [Nocardia coffeae]MBY8858027.1 thiamine pyrophosphate-binding protein [Nocardia coffeae]
MSTITEVEATCTHAQALAEAIARTGCTHVPGLMGDGNMHLFLALRQQGVAIVEVRHESAAVAMAEGYRWSSGHTGICSVTHGPGLTHVATSLVVASRNRSPLVLIAAETPAGYQGAQTFDQEAFVTSCEATYRRMTLDEHPAAALADAIALTEGTRRPVVLGIAADLLTAPVRAADPDLARTILVDDSDDLSAAQHLHELLTTAARPVLIAGKGAFEAADSMRVLADRFGAALATTLPAKGLFDGHDLDLGIAGGLAHPAAERVLRRADLVIAVGASMGRSTTQSGRLFADARVIKVVDEAGKGEVLPATAAGAMTHLVALTDAEATRRPWFTPTGPSTECWQEDLRDFAPPIAPGTVDPRRAVAEISTHIPDDAIVVISNGHCSGFAAAFLGAPRHGRFFAAQGFGSIGQTLTTAIGVALGAPGRKTVVFEGDAGFMMHAQELDTAIRSGVDLTLFILNDEALGTEYQRLRKDTDDAEAAVVPPPDLAALAEAFGGVRSATIDGENGYSAARAALAPGLAVVDVRTSRAVLSRHMRLPSAQGRQ